MATRAIICMKKGKNHLAIITYSDGYPSHTLEILKEHYNTPELVEKLISGGDIRTLYKKYEPNPLGFHTVEDSQPNVTTVYLRDFPKLVECDDEEIKKSYEAVEIDIKDFSHIEKLKYYDYLYVYNGKKWLSKPKYCK